MKRSRSPRDVWASLLPTAGAALALSAASGVPSLAVGSRASAGLLMLALLALPAALVLSCPLSAASLGAAAFLIAELVHRRVRGSSAVQLPERRHPLRLLETSGRVGLAALAAGGLWVYLAARRPAMDLPALGLAAGAVYLAV